jgi:membrane-bound lytic murein transglycosylase A
MRASKTLGVAMLLLVAACKPLTGVLPEKEADELQLKRSTFAALDGWAAADVRSAFAAFVGSCKRIAARADSDALGGTTAYGRVGEWRAVCGAAVQLKAPSPATARQFFEAWFVPAQAFNRTEPVGLFTGYYEPELVGSRKPRGRFTTALYARPADLVSVDLGNFRPALKGERIAGRVDGGKLIPYDTRAAIEGGALKDRSAPIAYVDDAAAAFFLHVQGSGRVRFADGSVVRVAYDGQNGHPYTAVGRVLVDRGEIARENLSMQAIRSWLKANPNKAPALMNENASFVFFKEQALDDPSLGAEGAQGVALTSEASLAVDLRFHALGAPMWVDGTAPADQEGAPDIVFRRLLVAQDTGGAIRGPVRGDVYWGSTARAESVAGRMAHKGQLYVLVPKAVAARLN